MEGEPKRGVTDCAFMVKYSASGTRSLILGAATPEERDRWMRAIEDATYVYVGSVVGAVRPASPGLARGAFPELSQTHCEGQQ